MVGGSGIGVVGVEAVAVVVIRFPALLVSVDSFSSLLWLYGELLKIVQEGKVVERVSSRTPDVAHEVGYGVVRCGTPLFMRGVFVVDNNLFALKMNM